MAALRYIADPEDQVRAVPLDGLTALFHAPSGTTHIVAPPAPEILAALREGPADSAELLARLAARFDVEGEAAAEAIAARLAELEAAGLVRRA
jgi:PqqD family protein of HPr-rel-A system